MAGPTEGRRQVGENEGYLASEEYLNPTVATEIAQAIGLQSIGPVRLREPVDFQSNRLYDIWADGRHLIAKEYLQPDDLRAAPLREYRALSSVSSLDIAPRPVFYEPSVGPIVVYEYMEGEMWDRRPASVTDLYRLVQVWLKMNSVSSDWVSRSYERPLQAMEPEFQHQMEAFLEWTATEYKPGNPAARNRPPNRRGGGNLRSTRMGQAADARESP